MDRPHAGSNFQRQSIINLWIALRRSLRIVLFLFSALAIAALALARIVVATGPTHLFNLHFEWLAKHIFEFGLLIGCQYLLCFFQCFFAQCFAFGTQFREVATTTSRTLHEFTTVGIVFVSDSLDLFFLIVVQF